MTNEERVKALEDIKESFLKHFKRICDYQSVDRELIITAGERIGCIFDYLSEFYRLDSNGDNTSKKGIVLEMLEAYSDCKLPNIGLRAFFDSPIEYLFYVTLSQTMPEHVLKKAYIVWQLEVCGGKYVLDFALCLRDGDRPLIGIECDGHEEHNKYKEQVARGNARDREIKRVEKIDVLHYSGAEIYKDCLKLAREFWQHVADTLPLEA